MEETKDARKKQNILEKRDKKDTKEKRNKLKQEIKNLILKGDFTYEEVRSVLGTLSEEYRLKGGRLLEGAKIQIVEEVNAFYSSK